MKRELRLQINTGLISDYLEIRTSDELENVVGQSLIAIGLYTVALEATALGFRSKVQKYLLECEPSRLDEFKGKCGTVGNTFDFCGNILLNSHVNNENDMINLRDCKDRRNSLAHEGYDLVLHLRMADVIDDIRKLHRISAKLGKWVIPSKNLQPEPKRQFPLLLWVEQICSANVLSGSLFAFS